MIYYAKLSNNKTSEEVLRLFITYKVPEKQVILDDSIVQKKDGSIYFGIKDKLIHKKEGLMIDSLTSLGKNNREIYNELVWLNAHRISLQILDIPASITATDDVCSILIDVFSSLAKREIQNTKEGQVKGIENAKALGRSLGRARINYPDNWDDLYKKWENKEITSKEFIAKAGLKKGTFYNLLKQYKIKNVKKADESQLA